MHANKHVSQESPPKLHPEQIVPWRTKKSTSPDASHSLPPSHKTPTQPPPTFLSTTFDLPLSCAAAVSARTAADNNITISVPLVHSLACPSIHAMCKTDPAAKFYFLGSYLFARFAIKAVRRHPRWTRAQAVSSERRTAEGVPGALRSCYLQCVTPS
ncbi:hypothetical protein BDY21DRAFT_354844 [Lineolata rhizophorae]|uniref:Uncharacterized protein n=1 Tax=Lineolata rhizophorae TaxID=578093 RepID=A0A6A6NQN4_9PEZI|nr:hypothetical protein BDY21DRAFT_354844 [Lineolata rhizophorae]